MHPMRSNRPRHATLTDAAQRLLRRLVDVRPGETAALLAGFAYFFCLLSGYYLLRPLRDAMGLVGGAGQLQWLFTATFVVMLLLVPVFGLLARRWPPSHFVAIIYRFFAINILCFGALFAAGVQELAVSRIFFVWISVYNLFVVSIFWSVLADRFSSAQGRRLFGFIAAGGTAGALAGPALAALLAQSAGVAWLAVLAALLLELALQCCRRLQREAPGQTSALKRDQALGGSVLAGVRLIMRDRYLLGIVGYLLLHSFASTFLYMEQGRIVAASLAGTAARTQLFATADLAVSCLSLLLQVAVTGQVLRRFGVVAGLVLLPLAGMAAFVAIALWPTLVVLVAAQGIRRAVDYALSRPAREVLFTVVSREAKYKAKSVIETVVYRGGDAASGWLAALAASAGIGFGGMAMLWLAPVAGWVALSAWLARRQESMASAGSPAPARTGSPQPLSRSADENLPQ
ncbi:NTP/NDP exchange transporter [Noviherbaspirillum suwonense]|nr:MFS transporter [Noviherbaspirillum suwonense]